MKNNELKIKVSGDKQRETIFKKVPASQLGLNDDFIKYIPKSEREDEFRDKVIRLIMEGGTSDFWCPVCDPSFDENGCICYEPGKNPAVSRSYNWWEENAKKFAPECGSRIGTKSEYVAFLAVLIKELVASGKSLEWAWEAVCLNSKELGHYWNSPNNKRDFEPTGSREVCGWCDIGNVRKILADDEKDGTFWLACGSWKYLSDAIPLATMFCYCNGDSNQQDCCGWLVFERCPDC